MATLGATPASATAVVLSENSSDEAEVSHLDMDAVVDFQVSGSTLTLTVENKTEAGGILTLSNTFFNVSMDVTGLSLTSATHSMEGAAPGWSLAPKDWTGPRDSNSTTQCAGFGVYNWALLFDRDRNHKKYEAGPGESIDFMISITCATGATCDMMDFGTNLSIDPVDDKEPILSLVCAKFRGLDGGDYKNLSGFGATQDPNYEDDSGGGEPPADEEDPFCGDGICNGVEDRCSCSNDCVFPQIEEYERYCSDDIDDDCNGDMDCDDLACSEDSACAVVEPPADPTCREVGVFCDSDADCCKNKCRGPKGRMSCKDGK